MDGRVCGKPKCFCGQSIIETVVGIIFLIPIVLFLLDLAVLVLANSANDNLAKSAARAAASATNDQGIGDGTKAQGIATNIANHFNESAIIKKKAGEGSFMTGFNWNGPVPVTGGNDVADIQPLNPGQVAVLTTMEVHLPVPFPGFSQYNFKARAVEPIVSIPP